MFNFDRVFIIDCPNGRFTFKGSVPIELCNKREPTRSDIMGGRVQSDGFVYSSKVVDSREQAVKMLADLADTGNKLAIKGLETERRV